jgi:hypothetical protein
MPITDNTYYINDIQLPVDEIGAILNPLIIRFEPEIIEKCLGFSLKNDFYAGLGIVPIAQKWLDLRDGIVYQIDGISYQWIGFKNEAKKSIISYFIYVEYLAQKTKSIVGSGGKINQSENGQTVDTFVEQCRAFNRGIELMKQLDTFINYSNEQTPDTYPNYEMNNPGKIILF